MLLSQDSAPELCAKTRAVSTANSLIIGMFSSVAMKQPFNSWVASFFTVNSIMIEATIPSDDILAGSIVKNSPVVDEEEDEGNLYNLFVCEDYVEKSWTFGELVQPLLCSNMSST